MTKRQYSTTLKFIKGKHFFIENVLLTIKQLSRKSKTK